LVFSKEAILVIFTGPSFDNALTPNKPLFFPEKVTNSVEGNDKEIFPISSLCKISSSSP
jgi:hypothetical protein